MYIFFEEKFGWRILNFSKNCIFVKTKKYETNYSRNRHWWNEHCHWFC